MIGRYEVLPAAVRPYDPRCPAVAERVAALIEARLPEAVVEHIGSTAIPGCDGKGVVDLLLMYPPGRLAAAKAAVDGLGFRRWDAPGAFPDERPVRIGAIAHDGTTFRLHVHIVAAGDPEIEEQRRFRDALRADPALVDAYVVRKHAIIAQGITYGPDFANAKGAFIQGVVDRGASTDV